MDGVRAVTVTLGRRLPCASLLALFVASVAQGAAAQVPQTLLLPSAVAYDAAGDLFFADTNRNQVFEVSLAGAVSVVAGTGEQGFAGDGGAATAALLNAPQGIAVGADNTIYVADAGNQRVRAIANGQIATVVGGGAKGFSGDGGPATAASLSLPVGVALDGSGALLICDSGNQRVRKVANGLITTIAGNGVEGFAGDGEMATAAELDSPAGIAVAFDGRIFIADARNNRLRVIVNDGTIQTFAGTGARGYAGDGGSAVQAKLFFPRAVTAARDGSVIFADSDNERIRRVDASGNISTIAGSGAQGKAADGSGAVVAALNTPRGVAVSSFGAPVYADAPSTLVREVAANGELYTIALPPLRASSVAFQASPTAVYGQGVGVVQVAGSVGTPQGSVALLDASTQVAVATLSSGTASLGLGVLAVGQHSLSVAYGGDGLNPAATSAAMPVSVSPANAVAVANGASVAYGAAIPTLSGTVSGILPQDAGLATASFTTGALPLSPVGSYPISASLSGSAAANYVLTLGPGSGSLQIVQAGSTSTLQPPSQNSYAGLPLVLTATIASTTSGVPTGQANFLDGASVVATAPLSNGIASGTYLAPDAGVHTLAVRYGGDRNFLSSTSAPLVVTVGSIPDFTLTLPAPSQTVQGGLIASYVLNVASTSQPFTGVVTFSVAGLPKGVTATFSPTQVVPGSLGATVMMNVQTMALGKLDMPGLGGWMLGGGSLWAICVPLALRRKRRKFLAICMCTLVLPALMLTTGCGARSISTASQASQTYPLTVTGTSTNLAGAVVTHSATVNLTVE